MAVVAVVVAEAVVAEAVAAVVEVVKMKTVQWKIFMILLVLQTACSPQSNVDSEVNWHNAREYTMIAKTSNDQPVMEVHIEYIGKEPYGDESIDHNWRDVDTDFYRETIENKSNSGIDFKEIRYSMKRGKLYTQRVKTEADIQPMYGTTTLEPHTSLVRDNAWVWGKRDNVLHRNFVFAQDHERFEADIPLVYIR